MNLHYQKIGKSDKILLAFHGMGQDFSCFQKFAQTFDNQYTTYLFDLPFHGKSRLNETTITKEVWKEYIDKFLQENQIQKFSIISFSMGGRFALATIEAFSQKIENIYLLAPDGVTKNLFYAGATRFNFTRNIFIKMLENNHKFHGFADFLVRMGIVHESVLKFAKIMVDTPVKYEQLYKSWIGFRYLKFDIKKIAQLINNQGIIVKVFIGKHDKLLTINHVFPLTKRLKNAELIILEATHGRLVEKMTNYLADNLAK
ncbi:MAG: alpha/beta fold hydrolase [Arcicella sp.]|nr:alpha/beta fold hydrolase [Arcicella sp.]